MLRFTLSWGSRMELFSNIMDQMIPLVLHLLLFLKRVFRTFWENAALM
jgi:hypothetical protein